jgi:type I site-specific restriction endonuclease
MSYQLNPMPEPEVNDWETAQLEDLRAEVKNLRYFTAQLFMQVKEWTTRMNDLATTGEQIIQTKAEGDAAYIALSNKTNEIDDHLSTLDRNVSHELDEVDENIKLIMESLGLADETAPDDTPQSTGHSPNNPYL